MPVTWLAHLLRLGILLRGTILPPERRAARGLARKRMQRVRSRTSHVRAVGNVSARQHGTRRSSNQVKRLTIEGVDRMGLPDVALAIKANVTVITTLSAQIDLLEQRLRERTGERLENKLLTSVSGIGQVLASTILLKTGPIERFASVGHSASYARCVGSVHTSNGNPYPPWAFVEAANFARRYSPEAKRFYERKKARTNPVVAIKALAHKLARA